MTPPGQDRANGSIDTGALRQKISVAENALRVQALNNIDNFSDTLNEMSDILLEGLSVLHDRMGSLSDVFDDEDRKKVSAAIATAREVRQLTSRPCTDTMLKTPVRSAMKQLAAIRKFVIPS